MRIIAGSTQNGRSVSIRSNAYAWHLGAEGDRVARLEGHARGRVVLAQPGLEMPPARAKNERWKQ